MNRFIKTKVCFRNDDVNILTPELVSLTNILINRGISITHAVEPCNITVETIDWLKKMKEDLPNLIEIVQHGWDHSWHDKGEFGGKRLYEEQYIDLRCGKEIMEETFGIDFFPMLVVPCDCYNKDTIKAVSLLQYKVFSVHYNYRTSRRIFYNIGHLLGKGQLFGRHISNHLNYYPGTQMFEIDTSISFIKKYLGYNECEMNSVKEITRAFNVLKKQIPVVSFSLHHRLHNKKIHIDLFTSVLDEIQMMNNVTFVNYEKIYQEYTKSH